MSKLELQRIAQEFSGVAFEESQRAVTALQPSLYDRIGTDGIRRLSELFYDRVFNDDQAWFVNIFSSSTKAEAIENQWRFFVQTFGGPDLYRQKKGKYTRLAGRHANYAIGNKAATRWVEHMEAAMEEHEKLRDDREAVELLCKYFRFTSHYIVAAGEFMRPDQLSGGTKIDAGRVW